MPSRREIKDSDEEDGRKARSRSAAAPAADEGRGDDRDGDDEADVDRASDPDRDEGSGETESGIGSRFARKGPRAAGRTRFQRVKAWFRDTRRFLYAAFFAGSFVLALLGVLSVFAPGALGAGLAAWFATLQNFNAYLFLAGLICIFTSGYLFFGLMAKRAEFKRLVSTKSKADFTHSLDHIERLAFELGSHENEVVAARKREFRIRH